MATLIYVLIKIFVPGDVIAPSFVYDMASHECLNLITWPMVHSSRAGKGKGNRRKACPMRQSLLTLNLDTPTFTRK